MKISTIRTVLPEPIISADRILEIYKDGISIQSRSRLVGIRRAGQMFGPMVRGLIGPTAIIYPERGRRW
jgi:hypothetical protein